MSTAPLTYGDTFTAAGLTWSVDDARTLDQDGAGTEHRATLHPIDPATGERLTTARIGRADRDYVYVNLDARPDGTTRAYPSNHGHNSALTDNQRQLILTDLAARRFALPPITPELRLSMFEHEVTYRAARAASSTLAHSTLTALRTHYRALSVATRDDHARTLVEAAVIAYREQITQELTRS